MSSPEPVQRRSFHIGRYHCTETLAQGPLGETFRAKVYGVAGLERQYALKQIDVSLRTDPELRSRLVDAAHRASTLEHERIAKLTEIHDEGDALYFVSELARGIDLARLLSHLRGRGETLPIDQAVLIAVDIAEALEAAALQREGAPDGVLHLGLCPSAISVLSEGEVRVADFAIAGPLARAGWADDDHNVGLLAYAAPERLRAQPASATADVWALGAVLYELCTGTPLIAGTNARELAATRARALPWDKLPWHPRLRELLETFLQQAPSARPQSAAAAREMLLGIIGLELTRARAGLQAIVKRALGRTLTRTGSFAAVAIPSSGYETLVHETPPAAVAPAPTRGRGWAPPRGTGTMQVVVPDGSAAQRPITLRGMGASGSDGEPAQMEHAELPPTEIRDTVRESMDELSFDDGVTSPQDKLGVDEPTRTHDARPGTHHPQELLAAEVIELELDNDQGARAVPPPMPYAATAPLPATAPSMPVVEAAPPTAPTMSAQVPTEPVVSAPVQVAPELVVAPVIAAPVIAVTAPHAIVSPPATPTPPRKGSGTSIVIGIVAVSLVAAFFVSREYGASTKPVPTETPVAKVEAPTPASKVDAPTPNVETPKVETPIAKVETPIAKVETPRVETPIAKVETPKVETPTAKIEVQPTHVPNTDMTSGQLSVATTPPGAAVWVDGEPRGAAPLSLALTPGRHRVAFVAPGMKLLLKTVAVEPRGAALTVTLEPAKLSADLGGSGGLKVRCRTLGELRILVDGQDTGLSCPNDTRISVSPGTHEIGLLSPRTGETKQIEGEIEDDADHSTRVYVKY